jgi:mannose-6-phosphate isomerase-like protein (cupin superfamily)
MASHAPYSINLEPKYKSLELIDIPDVARSFKQAWSNQTLCRVNDSVVRLAVVQGEFHWHKHDTEDEFFYVIDGKFLIDVEGRTIELLPKQGFVVPKGVVHRTRALEKATVLMVENATVIPTGN